MRQFQTQSSQTLKPTAVGLLERLWGTGIFSSQNKTYPLTRQPIKKIDFSIVSPACALMRLSIISRLSCLCTDEISTISRVGGLCNRWDFPPSDVWDACALMRLSNTSRVAACARLGHPPPRVGCLCNDRSFPAYADLPS